MLNRVSLPDAPGKLGLMHCLHFSLVQPWWASFYLRCCTNVRSYILNADSSILFCSCVLGELRPACIVDCPFLKPFSPDFQDMLVTLFVKTFTRWSPPRISLVTL